MPDPLLSSFDNLFFFPGCEPLFLWDTDTRDIAPHSTGNEDGDMNERRVEQRLLCCMRLFRKHP